MQNIGRRQVAGHKGKHFKVRGEQPVMDRGNNARCELPHYGVVRVGGADAQAFLQGQCTLDLKQLNESVSRLGAFCNPKGRVIALALFLVDRADYLL